MNKQQQIAVADRLTERLLVDVGKRVREDQKISTPATPTISPGPNMGGGPRMSAGPTVSTVSIAGPMVRVTTTRQATSRRVVPKPNPTVAARLAIKIQRMLPPDGDVVFAMCHGVEMLHPGVEWRNWNEACFWLASEYRVLEAVYEWMNAEYEAISDQLSWEEAHHDPIPAPDGNGDEYLAPTDSELCEAWDSVANDESNVRYLISVVNELGIHVGHCEVEAGWLLAQYGGLSREDLIPTLIVAETIRPEDLQAIKDDEEVYLNSGYFVTSVIDGDEFVRVNINPR